VKEFLICLTVHLHSKDTKYDKDTTDKEDDIVEKWKNWQIKGCGLLLHVKNASRIRRQRLMESNTLLVLNSTDSTYRILFTYLINNQIIQTELNKHCNTKLKFIVWMNTTIRSQLQRHLELTILWASLNLALG